MGRQNRTSRLGIDGRRGGVGSLRPGFTLVEVLLVVGVILILAWFVVPVFTGELKRRRLEYSIDQMQTMIRLTRAQAMNDGKRYRIRWPEEEAYEQADERGVTLQPMVEVEKDPIEEPGEFTEVKAIWARGVTLHDGIQCTEVRLGRPKSAEDLLREEEEEERLEHIADGIEEMFNEEEDPFEDMFGQGPDDVGSEEDEDPIRPPIVFEPDGTAQWAVILLTNGEEDEEGELRTWEVIIDGRTGEVGSRRTRTEAEVEESLAQLREDKEEKKIVRGREAGAK
jgi:prepilin-type N-terminal cleavage/methylation domain-containing protein